MRRANADIEQVSAPSKGLITRLPSNITSPDRRAIVAGENVRAEEGVLANAPGYERIISSPLNLDSPANLIFQANILDPDSETRTTPFIGTGSSLYIVRRRSAKLVCDVNGGGGRTCELTAAFLGDSGRVGSDIQAVANLIKTWSPDAVIHLGDIVYANGVVDPMTPDYEECVGQYFGADYVGGYNGPYGPGPTQNKFFPTLGNHDWDDGGIFNYIEFFSHAENPNKRYYHYKRGPVHFIHLDSGGFNPGSVDPDGYGLGSAQATWLESVLAASDCPFTFVVVHFPGWTSDSSYYPGIASTQSLAALFAKYNVTAVISGHSHNSELLMVPNISYTGGTRDVWQLIAGAGGHSLRGFHSPASPYSLWGNTTDYAALKMYASREECTFKWISTAGTVLHTKTFSTPRESSGICYIGDAAKSIFSLEVRPAEASVEPGFSWPFRAYANYIDGTVEEVTELSTWSSDDDTVANVGVNTGIAVGNTPGRANIIATYRGKTASGELHVLHSCVDDPTEVIFCISRAASMGGFSGEATRLDAVKEAVNIGIDAFDPEIDNLGLVSFAGTFIGQVEDATLDAPLTQDFAAVKDAVNLLVPDGANGIPSGLDAAYAELTGARHTDGNLRAVVLVVDWPANVTDPGGTSTSQSAAITAAMAAATVSATAIKALTSTTLIIIGYNVPSTYRVMVSNLATPGYFFDLHNADELKTTTASLPHIMCFYNGDYYYYLQPTCGNPVADYRDLFDWEVVRGCVDLAGVGPGGETSTVAWNPRPGNGMYLDMIGTSPDNAPDSDTTCGKIVTRESYPFVSGKQYKLSLYACNYSTPDKFIDVSIGTADKDVSNAEIFGVQRITPANADFALSEFTFTAPVTGSYPIVIDSEIIAPGTLPGGGTSWPKQGVLVDRVKLENITDTVEMFYNDFDNENPCSI